LKREIISFLIYGKNEAMISDRGMKPPPPHPQKKKKRKKGVSPPPPQLIK